MRRRRRRAKRNPVNRDRRSTAKLKRKTPPSASEGRKHSSTVFFFFPLHTQKKIISRIKKVYINFQEKQTKYQWRSHLFSANWLATAFVGWFKYCSLTFWSSMLISTVGCRKKRGERKREAERERRGERKSLITLPKEKEFRVASNEVLFYLDKLFSWHIFLIVKVNTDRAERKLRVRWCCCKKVFRRNTKISINQFVVFTRNVRNETRRPIHRPTPVEWVNAAVLFAPAHKSVALICSCRFRMSTARRHWAQIMIGIDF